jgi:hypothetical protein
VGLYSGVGAYIWNEVSVSTCSGLIHGGAYIRGGGAYSRRFTVPDIMTGGSRNLAVTAEFMPLIVTP